MCKDVNVMLLGFGASGSYPAGKKLGKKESLRTVVVPREGMTLWSLRMGEGGT